MGTSIFVELACNQQDIVVTSSVQCMCMRACIHLSGFVHAITYFMHGFQNNLAQMLSFRLKVKVTLDG